MKAAVYNGLFAESGPALPKPICQTGNCTYPQFTTLTVCSRCDDLTPYVTRYCSGNSSDRSAYGWQAPQGAKLQNSTDVFSMTSFIPSMYGDMQYTAITKLIFMGAEAQDGPPLNNP